ncbi:PPOX class F420-dependent oxidoreductase [Nocardia sp. CDC160]|uniref:PPOX class F420-dependent oxidoreductase n=1 Tax=Nocardia sp. CDC160 TaxID=3112166 RepID=UPI002DB7AAD7|nr:PPOX class F420-dependent oxidoreductase [Nocardia sp. CDC160]MEC3914411.1 PPOX class F420-dependent oxidoreductase [Nocardia sp. CDC160]
MGILAKFGTRMNLVYDSLRDRRAFELTESSAVAGDFEGLRGHRHAVLVTFRRSGEPVPSPVWFGLDDKGIAYIFTERNSGKVKRIRNNPHALIAPCNVRGRPLGPAMRATARVLDESEWPHAEQARNSLYRLIPRLYDRIFFGAVPEETVYLELSPRES